MALPKYGEPGFPEAVKKALIQGFLDHPAEFDLGMTVFGMVRYLEGFGLELNPATAAQHVRLIIHRNPGLFRTSRVGREKVYHLRRDHAEAQEAQAQGS